MVTDKFDTDAHQGRTVEMNVGEALVEAVHEIGKLHDQVRELEGQLRVANAIGDTFWEALKALHLTHIDVNNPGRVVTEVINERDQLRKQYMELIMAVGKKYHGETRHQTALRYIKDSEDTCFEEGPKRARYDDSSDDSSFDWMGH